MPTKDELDDGFTIGDCEILPNEGRVLRDGEEIRPEPQTLRVLLCLAEHDGKLVSRENLIDEVWGGRAISDDPINRAINQVRKCLGDSGKESGYVETLPKRGYRLLKPVQLHSPNPALNPAPAAAPVAAAGEHSAALGQRRWKVISALLAVGLLGFMYLLWSVRTDTPPAPPAKSVGVLPFENLSGQAEDEYLVSGFKVALVKALHGMKGHVVKSSRVSYSDMDFDEIARLLGVETILLATLERDGEVLRVSYEISKGGRILFTDHVDGTDGDLFSLQEKLSRAVRADFGADLSPALIAERRPESQAYDSFMRGDYALEHRGDKGNLEEAIELFQLSIDKDASYGPSYLGLATAYALLPDYRSAETLEARRAQLEEMNGLAIATIEAGIAADPSIENAAGAIYGFVRHKEKNWQASEESYLRAVNADVVDSNSFNWYSRMLASVGRTDEALKQALRALEIDPSSAVINSRVAMTYAWLNDSKKAHEFFERSNDLGASGPTHSLAYAFLLVRDGRLQQSQQVATLGMQLAGSGTAWIEPLFEALADEEFIPAALRALDDAAATGQVSPQVEIIIRTQFGDIEGAMQVAKQLEGPGEFFEMDLLYVSELKALREHPEFMQLLDRLGVTEYWRINGCVFENDQLTCEGA